MYDNLRKKIDFDDLLFESRNKDYGAYQLRKRYNSVVIAGIILASILVSLGNIGIENEGIAEIDINPLIIKGDTPVAVDALVVLKKK